MPAATAASPAQPARRTRLIDRIRGARCGFRAPFAAALALACLAATATAQGKSTAAASEAAAPVDAVALAIRDQAGGRLRAFYRPRGYWPLWLKDGTVAPHAARMIAWLESADLDGLDPRDYRPAELRRAIAEARGGTPETLARAELKLSKAFADYVGDVRRVPGVRITYLDRELEPQRLREDDVLRVAALAPSFADYVANGQWMSPLYVGLRRALRDQVEAGPDGGSVIVPDGPLLRVGDGGERVRLLRRRLGLAEGDGFDKALAAKLRAFQAAHDLAPDGVAGAATLAAINLGGADHERLLRLNLDRARILPGPWTRHVVVNAAAARLAYYGGGKEQGAMRVVVGDVATPTPMLAGMVRYATLNPYWNVPADLVQSRIAPRVLGGASFRTMRYEALSDWSAGAVRLDAAAIDWDAVAAGRQSVRVRQLPGGDNAMGRVKFMFPNDQGIYLHDTPNRALFKKDRRQFSNGCVRLEDAARLGTWLFGKPIAAASKEPEQHMPLPDPVPVYLTYLTAVPGPDGMTFLPDPYGRDAEPVDRPRT